jgi:hypothetical protein
MRKDAAIEEIRSVRHRISARYGHDTLALLTHYKALEKRYAGRMLKERRAPAREASKR